MRRRLIPRYPVQGLAGGREPVMCRRQVRIVVMEHHEVQDGLIQPGQSSVDREMGWRRCADCAQQLGELGGAAALRAAGGAHGYHPARPWRRSDSGTGR
ncbi:hypothetical protein [Nonomuraea rosea]